MKSQKKTTVTAMGTPDFRNVFKNFQMAAQDFKKSADRKYAREIVADINTGQWKKAIITMVQRGIEPKELADICNEAHLNVREFLAFKKSYDQRSFAIFFKQNVPKNFILPMGECVEHFDITDDPKESFRIAHLPKKE